MWHHACEPKKRITAAHKHALLSDRGLQLPKLFQPETLRNGALGETTEFATSFLAESTVSKAFLKLLIYSVVII